MLNEVLWLVLTIAIMLIVVLAYRFFGVAGLYAWMAVAIILANIQVTKTIRIFGLITAMGNVVYGTTFLVTDILNEKHGPKKAKNAVWIGFFMLVATTIVMQLTLLFRPDASDIADPALRQIFSLLPRIAFASLLAYVVSQMHDVWSFNLLKRKTRGRFLWFRNTGSTVISQLIDNTIFTLVALYGVFPIEVLAQIFVTSYIIKVGVAVLDTPFIYWAKRIRPKNA